MPLYDFRCTSCARNWEGLARWNADVTCVCGGVAERLISTPVVRPDIEPYFDDGLGIRVQSRAHKRDYLKQHDLVENDRSRPKHGTKGTVFSFAGQSTSSATPTGAYAPKQG